MASPLDPATLPGFRRRFVIAPSPGEVMTLVEDDYHCMSVTLRYDGETIVAVEPVMDRAPWTTCPGAGAVLINTFTGIKLTDAVARGAKQANCTHLHDLALLAAAHAHDREPLRYDIFVSDPIDGLWISEIRSGGRTLLRLEHRNDLLEQPEAIRGLSLMKLKSWIQSLGEPEREAARLLQWATLIAHGRVIPMERQSDATRLPPNCYTFQPENVRMAKRVGKIVDFSAVSSIPLEHFDGVRLNPRYAPNA